MHGQKQNKIYYKAIDDGIRTKKFRSNGEVTDYYLNGSNIITMITNSVMDPENSKRLDFYYDEQGTLLGFRYNGQDYWYIQNGQGDIAGILDSTGTQVVSYTYDSWGVPISVTGSMAETIGEINPFRYRGYYYDSETGLYYLNSRYYDPVIGRFLSIDDESLILASPDGLTDKNLFAYCDNNPVIRVDTEGEFWHLVAGAVIGTVISLATNLVNQAIDTSQPFSLRDLIIDGIAGGVSGFLTASGFGVVAGGIVSGAAEFTKQAFKGEFQPEKILVSATFGAISSKVGGTPKVSSQGNYAKSVVKQTSRRISNAVKNSSRNQVGNEVRKAVTYGVKNSLSSVLGQDLFNVFLRGGGTAFGLTISQSMTYRMQGLL